MCNRRRGQPSPYKCVALKRVRLTSNANKLVFRSFGPAISGSKVALKKNSSCLIGEGCSYQFALPATRVPNKFRSGRSRQ